MSAMMIGGLLGALAGFYLISRLMRSLLARFGDTVQRVVLADGLTLALSLALWWLTDDGTSGSTMVDRAWPTGVAFGVCLIVDLVALRGRRAGEAAGA